MRKYHCLRGEQIADAPPEINRNGCDNPAEKQICGSSGERNDQSPKTA
jgi:hypothetical protein